MDSSFEVSSILRIIFVMTSFLLVVISKTPYRREWEQNPNYHGPMDCADVLKNHFHRFSEYPSGVAGEQLNFLSIGESCNPIAEGQFLNEMKETYLNGTDNEERMIELQGIWERWRAQPDSGGWTGTRICNPRRLLECHRQLSKCVCRSTFKLFDAKDFSLDDQIVVSSEVVDKEVPNSRARENVTECRVKVDNICQWHVPWLGFCAIPCMDLYDKTKTYCVGQPMDAKRCRACDPSADLVGDPSGQEYKCFNSQHKHKNLAFKHQAPKLIVLLLITLVFIRNF